VRLDASKCKGLQELYLETVRHDQDEVKQFFYIPNYSSIFKLIEFVATTGEI
jgi:hypothetical protein